LGQGTSEENEILPSLISTLRTYKVVSIAAGWGHSVVMTGDGRAFVWGKNDSGQLGLGPDAGNVDTPRVVRDLTSVRLIGVACGACHTAFLTELGQVYIAGEQLGRKSVSPTLVPLDFWCVAISCGPFQTVAVCQKGNQRSYYVWGKNSSGELGIGSKQDQSIPTAIPRLDELVVMDLHFGMNCGFAVVLDPAIVESSRPEVCNRAFNVWLVLTKERLNSIMYLHLCYIVDLFAD
jgi:alpha-tubulin suppressor-like RCC1 family protein